MNNKNTYQKYYFHTFGNNIYQGALNRIEKQAKKFNIFSHLFMYNENDLKNDTHFWNKHKDFINNNKRGYGYWIWKPYCILKSLEKIDENDIVVICDSGCELNYKAKNRLLEYFKMLNKSNKSLLCFQLNQIEKNWTKMDLIDYINCYNLLDTRQIMATILIIKKNEISKEIIKIWYETCCKYHLIDDSKSILPNDESFIEHRHDQSCFSLICKKYDSNIILNDETYYWPWNIKESYINYPILSTRNSNEKSILNI